MPAHFEQASADVTEDQVADLIPCQDRILERHARRASRAYLDAGYDHVYVTQIGDDQAGFLRFFFDEVGPPAGTLSGAGR